MSAVISARELLRDHLSPIMANKLLGTPLSMGPSVPSIGLLARCVGGGA
jgi:hypothetical protein